MKLFITGTESFVGQELIKKLNKNYELFGCDITDPSDSRFHKADIRSNDILDIVPENVDAIIHLAALSTDPLCKNRAYRCFDINVMGTLNLINIAEKKNCKQFIFASSEWVYDNFTNEDEKTEESIINIANVTSEYALSKLVSEANLRQKYQHGFCNVTILRFGIIYGARKKNWSAVESIFNSVKYDDDVVVGSKKTGRCFVHVSDIVKGIIKSIGLKGFEIINLESDNLITLEDVIDIGCKIVEKNISVEEKTPESISIRKVSSKKAREIINWKTEIGLEDSLRELNKIL